MSMLLDTHYHFDFIPSQAQRSALLETLTENGVGIIAQSVLPSAYLRLREEWGGAGEAPGLSVGLHPWWIRDEAQAETELAIFADALEGTRFVGEIGLDFSPRRLESVERGLQLAVLERILRLAADRAERIGDPERPVILSIHAVQSAGAVLDALRRLGAPRRDIAPILHRFSGTSDEL